MRKIAVCYVGNNNNIRQNNVDEKKIDDWCTNNHYDYDLFKDYVSDYSDTKDRLSLNRLKTNIIYGDYDRIVILSLPNVSNNIFFNAEFVRYVHAHHCNLISLDGTNPLLLIDFCIDLLDEIEKFDKEREENMV